MEWPLRLQSGEGGEGHQVASAPLRGEQGLRAAGFPGFQMRLGSWLEGWGWVSECKHNWVPYSMRAFLVSPNWSAHLSCSIPRGLRCLFSPPVEMGVHFPLSSRALNLELTACGVEQSEFPDIAWLTPVSRSDLIYFLY